MTNPGAQAMLADWFESFNIPEQSPYLSSPSGIPVMITEAARGMIVKALRASAVQEAIGTPDYIRERGRYYDIIVEALVDYDGWMLDDDYEATPVLYRIMNRMRERLEMSDPPVAHPAIGTPDNAREALIEQCAKIADPWPGFNVGQKITEPDLSVIEVRNKIAAAIRALATLPPEQDVSKTMREALEECVAMIRQLRLEVPTKAVAALTHSRTEGK